MRFKTSPALLAFMGLADSMEHMSAERISFMALPGIAPIDGRMFNRLMPSVFNLEDLVQL